MPAKTPTPRARLKVLKEDLKYARTYTIISYENYIGYKEKAKRIGAEMRECQREILSGLALRATKAKRKTVTLRMVGYESWKKEVA
jgi:hypothetical protein